MLMSNARRNPERSTEDKPNYFHVVRPFAFHQDDPTLSPTASSVGGVQAHAALAAPDLTENATATHDSAAPTVLRGVNHISNLAPPMGLEDQ